MTLFPAPDLADVEAALHSSHDRLAAAVADLDTQTLRGPSFASEWTVADVLSHLGSGAEIFALLLDAALAGREAPQFPEFQAVWDRWNAKEPEAQALDTLEVDAALLATVAGLDAEQRAALVIESFMGPIDLRTLLRLRLGEHAVHTWDIVVAQEADAELAHDVVPLLLFGLEDLVARAGQRHDPELRVRVTLMDPEGSALLVAAPDGPRLQPLDDSATASVTLPAEAFIRLVYGRLDPPHTPVVGVDGVELDTLRVVFPGF